MQRVDWFFDVSATLTVANGTATLTVANGNDFTHETVKHVTVKVRFLQECVIILVACQ